MAVKRSRNFSIVKIYKLRTTTALFKSTQALTHFLWIFYEFIILGMCNPRNKTQISGENIYKQFKTMYFQKIFKTTWYIKPQKNLMLFLLKVCVPLNKIQISIEDT